MCAKDDCEKKKKNQPKLFYKMCKEDKKADNRRDIYIYIHLVCHEPWPVEKEEKQKKEKEKRKKGQYWWEKV